MCLSRPFSGVFLLFGQSIDRDTLDWVNGECRLNLTSTNTVQQGDLRLYSLSATLKPTTLMAEGSRLVPSGARSQVRGKPSGSYNEISGRVSGTSLNGYVLM